MSRFIGEHEILREVTLADGGVIALVRTQRGWLVELGLTDRVVQHCITGVDVPVTTSGCVWCGGYEELCEEAFNMLTRCASVKEADKVSSRWWRDNMEALING